MPALDLTPLSPEEAERVSNALYPPQTVDVGATVGQWRTDYVRLEKLSCLRDGDWLNDEVLNFRFQKLRDDANAAAALAGARSWATAFLDARGAHGCRPTYVQTTMFLTKLTEGDAYNYAGVRRWTKRTPLDWANVHWVIVPVHLGIHWALAVVDVPGAALHYYDSMAPANSSDVAARVRKLLDAVLRWVSDDSADKRGEAHRIDTSGWETRAYSRAEVPQQKDGNSCGMFMCTFAACIATGRTFDFDRSTSGMNLLRRRLVLEILDAGRDGGATPVPPPWL